MYIIWKRFPAILVFLFSQSLPAQEIGCDNGLMPESNTLGYKIRASSARCEGLYRSPVNSSLDIVGFRYGSASLISKNNILIVSTPSIKQLDKKILNIRAEAIPIDTYYRMDAVVTESQPLTWPLNEVVIPAGISPDDLGIFGWIEQNSAKILVPVNVHSKDIVPISKSGNGLLTMLVRPAINVEKILWRIYKENSVQRPQWNELEENQYPIRKSIALVIPDGPAEILGLDLVAKMHKKPGWEDPQEFKIYRAGK